jgi:hypothetical protein
MKVPAIGRHRVSAKEVHPGGKLWIVCHHHAAFSCGDDFISEEREATKRAKCSGLDVIS